MRGPRSIRIETDDETLYVELERAVHTAIPVPLFGRLYICYQMKAQAHPRFECIAELREVRVAESHPMKDITPEPVLLDRPLFPKGNE